MVKVITVEPDGKHAMLLVEQADGSTTSIRVLTEKGVNSLISNT